MEQLLNINMEHTSFAVKTQMAAGDSCASYLSIDPRVGLSVKATQGRLRVRNTPSRVLSESKQRFQGRKHYQLICDLHWSESLNREVSQWKQQQLAIYARGRIFRTMASPTQVLKSVGPKLVPFFKTVAIYFVLFIPVDKPSLFAMAIKCLPILSLVVFVLLHGMSLGDEYAFSRRILIGLVFSSVGDAFLIWPNYFMHGMAAFGVAQIMYISAFGFKPMNLQLGAVIYGVGALTMLPLLPGMNGIFLIGIPVYSVLLVTMSWRAIARVQLFEELWTWTKLCSCVGGLLFVISDSLIAFDRFHSTVPYSQALIMTTYYAAQLGIALSVVDSKASYNREQENALQNTNTSKETKIRRAIPISSN